MSTKRERALKELKETLAAMLIADGKIVSKTDLLKTNIINITALQNTVSNPYYGSVYGMLPPFMEGVIESKVGYLRYKVLDFDSDGLTVNLELYTEKATDANGWQRFDAVTAYITQSSMRWNTHTPYSQLLDTIYVDSTPRCRSKSERIFSELIIRQKKCETVCADRLHMSLPSILVHLFLGAVNQINGILYTVKPTAHKTAATIVNLPKTAATTEKRTACKRSADGRIIRKYGNLIICSKSVPKAFGGSYEFHTDSWQRRGHLRRNRRGDIIYIQPTICRRHKEDDSTPNVVTMLFQ